MATFIRTTAELAAIARHQPFPAADLQAAGVSLYVGFLAEALGDEAQQKLLAFRTPVDEFHIQQREIYWLCRVRSSESTFSLAGAPGESAWHACHVQKLDHDQKNGRRLRTRLAIWPVSTWPLGQCVCEACIVDLAEEAVIVAAITTEW